MVLCVGVSQARLHSEGNVPRWVMAAATFGQQWAGKVVQFVVDNETVMEVIRATYSDLHMMHLIRQTVGLLTSKYDFGLQQLIFHIPGNSTWWQILYLGIISLYFSHS